MSRVYSHFNTAKYILKEYKGEMPLNAFLKSFFAKEKKYGSRDRKTISSFCYNYFRVGFALKEQSMDEKILVGTFLTTNKPNELLEQERPNWNRAVALLLDEKIQLISFDVDSVFGFNEYLSEKIEVEAFNKSILIQPDLFIRVRNGAAPTVKQKLDNAKVSYREISESCLAFENGTKLENLVDINREAVIQDFNSQRIGEFIAEANLPTSSKVWDCCAASGGKSIMAYDLLSNIQLTVSDVRQSIIHNLHTRFKEAGLKNYYSFVADLTSRESIQAKLNNSTFDLIICDAPCSGSGTWSRTPEQLVFFKQEEILRYSELQKKIAANAILYLNQGGYLLYITCSVFKNENEEVVDFILQNDKLELVKMELLTGYEKRADTMFAALFKLN